MKITVLVILFFLIAGNVPAQERTFRVSGVVTEENTGEPLIGGIVSVKGTTINIITDIDGKYELSVKTGDILIFSYIGYERQEIPVNNRPIINVVLKEDYPDMGLPSTYYIRSNVYGTARTSISGGYHDYMFDVLCSLPYTTSERYGTSVYDRMKSMLSVGVNVARMRPEKDHVKGSLYFELNMYRWLHIEVKRDYMTRFSASPYAITGLYIDALHGEIQSQNFKYGGGGKFSLNYRKFGVGVNAGYEGYTRRSLCNNFYFEISPRVKGIPFWIKPKIGYQAFTRQSRDNNFYIGVRIHALKESMIYY